MTSLFSCCMGWCGDTGSGHVTLKEMPTVQLDTHHMGKMTNSHSCFYQGFLMKRKSEEFCRVTFVANCVFCPYFCILLNNNLMSSQTVLGFNKRHCTALLDHDRRKSFNNTVLDATGTDVVIVKSGRRICGTGGCVATAPLHQNKSYFELKIQSSGKCILYLVKVYTTFTP